MCVCVGGGGGGGGGGGSLSFKNKDWGCYFIDIFDRFSIF